MSRKSQQRGKSVATLERWRQLELDNARAELAAAEEIAQRARDTVQRTEGALDAAHRDARQRLVGARAMSVEDLQRAQQYAAWQKDVLTQQRQTLARDEQTVQTVRDGVVGKLREKKAVSRLRSRHERELRNAANTEAYKQSDEHGVTRASAGSNESAKDWSE